MNTLTRFLVFLLVLILAVSLPVFALADGEAPAAEAEESIFASPAMMMLAAVAVGIIVSAVQNKGRKR